MTALVGCVLSYALLMPGAPSATDARVQEELCAATVGGDMLLDLGRSDTVGACRLNVAALLQGGSAAAGTTTTYSNPVEVNCPTPRQGSAAAAAPASQGASPAASQVDRSDWFHGCDVRAFDFRYRVSRFPESERQSGALGPQRERRMAARSSTLVTGVPPRGGTLLSLASPPLALYAVAGLVPPLAAPVTLQPQRSAPTRVVEPLERPPRA